MDQERSFESPILSETGNPWRGFAAADHRADEYEGLLRTLRFASIQLNKFWVEFNAFPVFMNEMKGTSIRQIEKLFDWFQAAPEWSARVSLPRLVPELHGEISRPPLMAFTSQVVRARMLRAGIAQGLLAPLATMAELGSAIARLDEVALLARQLGLESEGLAGVDSRIQDLTERLERNGRLQAFFSRLSGDCGLGTEATEVRECGRVFQAVELIRNTKLEVWSWRRPQVLAAQNRARILALQERSEPLVQARARLEPCFRLEERVAAAQLRLLSEKILAAGLFRFLSSDYKQSLARYRGWLKLEPGAKPPKASRAQIAAQLNDWASYLEFKSQIEDNAEAKALLAPHFKGIDTHFDGALEANTWAGIVRAELDSEDKGTEADFCSRLADSLFATSQEKLLQAVDLCSGAGMQAIQGILARPEYVSGQAFSMIGCEDEARWMAATRLRDHLVSLGFLPTARLSEVKAIREAAGDLLGILKAMETSPEPKAAFKRAYVGEHTDLSLLVAAQDYIDFVAGAELSSALKSSFLTAHGPQRLQDTRTLVAPALAGLAHVKEHFRRLAVATHGQSRALEDLPLLDLIQRIQRALKQPSLLGVSVGELRNPTIQ